MNFGKSLGRLGFRENFQLKKCYWRSGMASKSVKLRRPDKGHRAQSLPLRTDRQYSSELDGVCGVHFQLQPTVRRIQSKSGEACKYASSTLYGL